MKILILVLLAVVLVVYVSCGQIPEERPYVVNPDFDKKISRTISFTIPVVSPEEAQKMGEDVVFLDAREEEEYEVSHIKNARNVGYNHFDISEVEDIPRDSKVVLYCSIGYRSEKIGQKLKKHGFREVYNLYGSIFEWINQGYPVVDSKGAPTRKIHTYNKTWSKWVDEKKGEKVW